MAGVHYDGKFIKVCCLDRKHFQIKIFKITAGAFVYFFFFFKTTFFQTNKFNPVLGIFLNLINFIKAIYHCGHK